ncbi:MAG TPA: penicillin-insensitive murein endopeptidase [Solirubrobacteraceae bacterium]|nr:penicillin-insensitive murein endopeptidase [Solirubrobacteraceae bacterium]
MPHRLIRLLVAAAVAGGLGLGAVSASGAHQSVGRIQPLQVSMAPVVTKPATPVAPTSSTRRPPSRAVGKANDGRLLNGVMLPDEGRDLLSWDPILHRWPNREWRRFATQRLLAVIGRALREYRRANPGAPRVLVGDLSLPQGGPFGRRYGGLGHASHQNGLDVDLFYPRRDGRQREPWKVSLVHRRLSQRLVDAFVAQPEVRLAFVGFDVGVEGPPRVVQQVPLHNDHVHIRISPR